MERTVSCTKIIVLNTTIGENARKEGIKKMNNRNEFFEKPSISPVLDRNFLPAVTQNKKFAHYVLESGKGTPLAVALERGDGSISTYKVNVFNDNADMEE